MCVVKIHSPTMNAELDIKPQQDFFSCLMSAAIAALPAFLEAFMACLGGGSTPGTYKPGDRRRCS